MCCGRAGTRSMPRSPPCSCRSWPSRRSPAPAPVASWSCTPARSRTCSTSSSPLPVSVSTVASRLSSCPWTCASARTRCSASTSDRRRAAPTARRSAWPRRSSASAARGSATSPPRRLAPRARASRWSRCRRSCSRCCARSSRSRPECAAIYAPEGRLLREGDTIRLPELGDLLDRLGAEGPGFLYSGDVAASVSDWVLERGGILSRDDLSSYEVIEREPARVTYQGREVITNPPPSSGGILIADALGILERLERPHDPYMLAEVIASTNRARDEEFLAGPRHRGLPGALPRQEGARHAWPRRCARGLATRRTSR